MLKPVGKLSRLRTEKIFTALKILIELLATYFQNILSYLDEYEHQESSISGNVTVCIFNLNIGLLYLFKNIGAI
jgi:hypothetical protein